MPSRAKRGHQSMGPQPQQSTTLLSQWVISPAPWVGFDLLAIHRIWNIFVACDQLVIKRVYVLPLMCSQGSPPSLEVFVDLRVTRGAVSQLLVHNDLLPFDTQLNYVIIILYRNAVEKWQFFQYIYGWEGGLQQCMKGLLLHFAWPWVEFCLCYRPHSTN